MNTLSTGRSTFALLGGLALAASASAAEATLEERLAKLESEVVNLRQENAALRSEIGVDKNASVAAKAAGKEASLSVGGFFQMQTELGDKGDARFSTANDRFYLRRARINLQGKFAEHFEFRLEGEFAGSIPDTSGFRAQTTDAYITWNRYSFANVRFGQFKTPFGAEQVGSDLKALAIERSLVNDRLTLGRQLGFQVCGDFAEKRFTYATGLFNGTGVNTNSNDDNRFLWAGRATATVLKTALAGVPSSLVVGLDAYQSTDAAVASCAPEFSFDLVPGGSKDNTFAGDRRAGGLDLAWNTGAFDLSAEYLRSRFSPKDVIPHSRFDSDGWYVQASYYAIPKVLQPLLRYDTFTSDLKLADRTTSTWTLGTNYFLKGDDLKLMANYMISDVAGQPSQNRKLILRLQAVF